MNEAETRAVYIDPARARITAHEAAYAARPHCKASRSPLALTTNLWLEFPASRLPFNFGEYPRDFFDFIIMMSATAGVRMMRATGRGIMEYFSPAVQLGLTATPKRKENATDTYKYFGEPVYIYSLKEGINDGFLTPFKVKQIQTTMDYYVYTPDDTVR